MPPNGSPDATEGIPPAVLAAVEKLCRDLSPEQASALAAMFEAMGDQPEAEGREAVAALTEEWMRASNLILDNSDTDAPMVEGEDTQEVAEEEAGTPEEPDTAPTAEDGPQDMPQDRGSEIEDEVEDLEEEDLTEALEARAQKQAKAKNMLKVARSQIGYREGANNNTKYGRWYKLNHQPWCAMFVSWVAAKSGAGKVVPKFAYCPSGAAWFRKRKRWGQKPKVGAIVFFKFSGKIDHVGIVEARRKGGGIVTIEGNTSDAVRRRVRRTHIAGYGYPAYS
jgi:hypothetical protein